MINLKILFHPSIRWNSNIHPYYRWRKQLRDQDIKVELCFDHQDKRLRNSDFVIIHSRFFSGGWQNVKRRTEQNELELINFLTDLRIDTGKVIWYDEADSSGSADFPIIPYVDVFAKKQILKDTSYYTKNNGDKDLRIWLNDIKQTNFDTFMPCPIDQLYKLKASWNLSVIDYRYYPKRFNKLSNFVSYKLYSPKITPVSRNRDLDLTFRGSMNYDRENNISFQRNKVFETLQTLNLNIATGGRVGKQQYLKELSRAKVSISPFGYGEICYRDFESFNAGCILIKPSVEHLITYPNIFIPNRTYIPVKWDMSDIQDKLEDVLANYHTHLDLARYGQNLFVKTINDPDFFIGRVKSLLYEPLIIQGR